MTVHLAPGTRAELDILASALHCGRDALIADAVAAYLDTSRWHVAQIEDGLRQAENGNFATDHEIDAAYAAFG